MADARIVAYAKSTPPAGWLTCDGSSLVRADHPELFAAIGTTYGAADATHFSLPDLRARFAMGKAASGTGSTLGGAAGTLGHTHSLSHGHAVTQPGDHVDHTVTDPAGHGSLTHSGFGAADHPAQSHSGMSVSNHSVSKSDGHGTHNSGGSHDHNSHSTGSVRPGTGGTQVLTGGGAHNAAGAHSHDSHSAHDESVSAHNITSQGANHPSESHSATQPDAHGLGAHSFTVSGHTSHTGAAIASADVEVAASDPPYLALIYIIAPTTTPTPAGSVIEHGANTAPADHLACDGQAVNRTTYADLFAVIGTVFGAGNGSTTFNLPDLRGRHVVGGGTGASFAATGGAAGHTHAGGSHGHSVTQPAAHGAHSVSGSNHPAQSHSGAAIAGHTMSHSGFAVASHSVGQSSGHGTHSSAGSHDHDAHGTAGSKPSGSDLFSSPTTHSDAGGHTHDGHGSHSGAGLSGHVEDQASNHTPSHSVTQPDNHGALSHTGAGLDAHSAHSGAALASASSATTDAADAPFLALRYCIRTTVGGQPIGSLYKVGQATAPSGALIADGRTVSRSTYADLFGVVGTTFGAGDGSTTFALPDLRGRIARGSNGDLATAGGSRDHSHAVSSTHGHSATQPATHSSHAATQPSGHGSLTHSGASVASHTLNHSGADLNNHSASQASSHGVHSNAGSHTHNSHSKGVGVTDTGALVSAVLSPTTHSSDGSHDHGTSHPHSGFGVNSHSVGQANSHSMGHSEDQPNDHAGFGAHSGFDVNAHAAHSGFAATVSGTGTTDTANVPHLVVLYVIQAGVDVFYQEASVSLVGGGDFAAIEDADYEVELGEVSLTPPSSPLIYILDAPT